MKIETDTQSSIINNDKITHEINTSEEISCNKDSEKLMNNKCDDNENNVINIKEEA